MLAVLFVVLLWLPVLQRASKLFPEPSLFGVEQKAKKPELSLRTWLSGGFQEAYDRYFTERVGLRGYLVRTYNQFNFSLFRELPKKEGTRIVVGRDNWLYERDYLETYNEPCRKRPEKLERIVRGVKRLQDELGERGVAFLLVLAPSKVEVYPEYLPAGLLAPGRGERLSAYDRMRPLLEEAGVNLVDAVALFKTWKPVKPHPLFSRGGVHWNYYSAGLVVEEIVRRLEELTGRDLVNLSVRGVEVDYTAHGTDNDIGDLLNLWKSRSMIGPQVHPVFDRQAGRGAHRLDLLFVGDSFVRTLAEIMDAEGVQERCDIFFYFKRRFAFPGDREEKLSRRRLDWTKEVLSRDAVIIEINEHWMPDIGFGFVEAALEAFSAAPAGEAAR